MTIKRRYVQRITGARQTRGGAARGGAVPRGRGSELGARSSELGRRWGDFLSFFMIDGPFWIPHLSKPHKDITLDIWIYGIRWILIYHEYISNWIKIDRCERIEWNGREWNGIKFTEQRDR